MRLRLFDCYRNPYGGRLATALSRNVWLWTPVSVAVFVGLDRILQLLPIHPFLASAGVILIPIPIAAISIIFLPGRIGWPLNMFTGGASFALAGARLAWWTYYLVLDPTQQNKLELLIVIGFASTALLTIGSSIVTALLLGLFESHQSHDQRPPLTGDARDGE